MKWGLDYDTTGVTVELRRLVEQGVPIWSFDYPSFYEGAEKEAFEKKVIDHYYFRQIGQETVARWLHMFRARIREIMPYYKQLYESQLLMQALDDPFGNVDMVETFQQESTGETNSEGAQTVSTNHTREFSNTPQGSINNLGDYLTEGERNNAQDSTEGSNTATTTGTMTYTHTRRGNQGVNTYAHDMKELRDTFLNIDMMIIDELKDLFLQVY